MLRSGGVDALRAEQLGDELAEHDRLAVGDEVDAARAGRARRPASGPRSRCRRASSRCGGGRRRSTRSAPSRPPRRAPAGSSCRPRPTRAGAARRPSRSRRRWRRARPARPSPWWRSRAPSSPAAAARPRSRSRAARPASSAASVPTCTKRRTPAARAASSALRVPPTLTRSNSARSPHSPRCAAAWKATSAPSAPARIASTSSRSPRDRLGAARGDLLRRRVRARERAHPPAVRDQPPDQPAADEPGAAGHERGAPPSAFTRASPCPSQPARRSSAPSATPTSITNAVKPAGRARSGTPTAIAAQHRFTPRILHGRRQRYPTNVRQDQGHRAARLARAPRRRGARARRSSRACSAPPTQLGRELRIPGFRKGKVPGADGDPAHRPRGGARAGGARLAARVVRGGDPALGRLDRRRPEARPDRAARRRASR